MSTAEAISVVTSGMALASHFGDGRMKAADVASGILGAIVKDPVQDKVVMQEYNELSENWKVRETCMEAFDM
jgi:hypothetical protein